jgi:hypothetical protein
VAIISIGIRYFLRSCNGVTLETSRIRCMMGMLRCSFQQQDRMHYLQVLGIETQVLYRCSSMRIQIRVAGDLQSAGLHPHVWFIRLCVYFLECSLSYLIFLTFTQFSQEIDLPFHHCLFQTPAFICTAHNTLDLANMGIRRCSI